MSLTLGGEAPRAFDFEGQELHRTGRNRNSTPAGTHKVFHALEHSKAVTTEEPGPYLPACLGASLGEAEAAAALSRNMDTGSSYIWELSPEWALPWADAIMGPILKFTVTKA